MLLTAGAAGWYSFQVNASDYGNTYGMFLGVVIRQNDAANYETWFGLSTMTAPNDWANYDWSWDNRIKFTLPKAEIDGLVCGEASRTIPNLESLPAPANVVASGYVQFQARVTPAYLAPTCYYEWTASAGTLVAPTAGVGLAAVKWDAPDGHQAAVTLTLTVREAAGGAVVCTATASLQTIRPYVVRVRFVDDALNEEQQIDPLPAAEPEYNAIAGVNHAVCYVRNRGLQVECDLAGAEHDDGVNSLAAATPLWIGTQALLGGRVYPFRDDVTENPQVQTEVRDWATPDYGRIILESVANIPNKVALYPELKLQWTFQVKRSNGVLLRAYTGAGDFSHETLHGAEVQVVALPNPVPCALFSIFDPTRVPTAEFTAPHLTYACLAASGETSMRGICSAIHADLVPRFDLHCYDENPWAVVELQSACDRPYCPNAPSRNRWDCITLSRGMARLVRLLGIRDAEPIRVYPSTNRNCLDQESVPPCNTPGHGPEEFLVWCGGWNNFEATCRVDGWYYLGGIRSVQHSDLKVLRHWLGNESLPPDQDRNGVFQCYTSITVFPPDKHDYCRIVPCP